MQFSPARHISSKEDLQVPAAPDAAASQAEVQAGWIQIPGSPEAALNQQVKNLIQKLGEAIHESVSESESIAGVVKNIRDQGFDVLLMLEATIGLNQVEPDGEADGAAESDGDSESEDAAGSFTRRDLSFLKSLRISLPDSDGQHNSHDISLPTGPSANPPADE